MNTFKIISIVCLFVLTALASYALGYFNGTNNTALFLATNNATMNFAALNYLENQQVEEVRKLQENEVEINIATIEDIMVTENNYSQIPRRVKLYHESFAIDPNQITKLRDKYSKLRNKNNLTSH